MLRNIFVCWMDRKYMFKTAVEKKLNQARQAVALDSNLISSTISEYIVTLDQNLNFKHNR